MTTKSENNSGHAFPFQPRVKIQPGGENHLRQPEKVAVPDIEQAPMKYMALALLKLRESIGDIATMAEDNSRPVDEYQPQTLTAETETNITLQPQWEVSEVIKAVLITGPAGAVTVQLGDRVWTLTIPASGFLILSPLWLLLERSDPRILTVNTPGQYTFELMGHADSRGNLV